MSNSRLKEFDECVQRNDARRQRYGVQGVTYGDRMQTDAEVRGLLSFLKDRAESLSNAGPLDMEHVMRYDTLQTMDTELLCRFPRPRELSRLARYVPGRKRTYLIAHLKLRGRPDDFARFVGSRGKNFAGWTALHRLLYLWLDRTGGDGGERELRVYGTDMKELSDLMDRLAKGASGARSAPSARARARGELMPMYDVAAELGLTAVGRVRYKVVKLEPYDKTAAA